MNEATALPEPLPADDTRNHSFTIEMRHKPALGLHRAIIHDWGERQIEYHQGHNGISLRVCDAPTRAELVQQVAHLIQKRCQRP